MLVLCFIHLPSNRNHQTRLLVQLGRLLLLAVLLGALLAVLGLGLLGQVAGDVERAKEVQERDVDTLAEVDCRDLAGADRLVVVEVRELGPAPR